MKRLLKNGTVVNPAAGNTAVGDVLFEDGVILQVGGTIEATADMEVYDVTGKIVTPGLIDMHVHLREPGQEAKESIVTGTRAAAAGGFTRVATMANTTPVIDNLVVFNGVRERIRQEARVKVEIIGAVSQNLEGKVLSDMGDMAAAGAVAFSDDGAYIQSAEFMRRALEYASTFGKMVIDHAEDTTMTAHGCMHEGPCSVALGLEGRPRAAEDLAVARDLLLAEMTGAHIHIAHVSSARAVELVRAAKARGVRCTAEVTAHHLSLTDEEIRAGYDTAFKVAPPLREESDRAALLAGLADGTLDAVVTDHSPHAAEEKDVPFCCAPNGMSGLETSLAAVVTYALEAGHIDWERLVDAMSVQPARLLGVAAGVLEAGAAADITVIDPQARWTVETDKLYTLSLYSPFAGKELRGKAVQTWVDGELVMENGRVR
ncbi:MAG: dihydroorotase [Veillonellaceae bacterium]|nr:dihydroorotase [Veillonellaceae bacterium]